MIALALINFCSYISLFLYMHVIQIRQVATLHKHLKSSGFGAIIGCKSWHPDLGCPLKLMVEGGVQSGVHMFCMHINIILYMTCWVSLICDGHQIMVPSIFSQDKRTSVPIYLYVGNSCHIFQVMLFSLSYNSSCPLLTQHGGVEGLGFTLLLP